ncbi:uncharacterized protein ACHE_40862A [Aspergillus chevalieri]|uniref:Protein ZIP4 homolog n=1 Tax=Aspergillus chevalieri TaxID=182096 RepID=A0A7R7VQK8_ASPCH|nr:uncharacterized protein ACHE_40862A [Aspergillus chevalieri]BCR88298.1 hypothetical protein ACHE_40862A [Aspergillus chevalieri]
MASTPATASQEQASTVTEFAKDLQDLISSTTASSSSSPLAIPDDTLRTLDTHLNHLPLSRTALTVSTRRQLDTKGTELWNTCLQIMVMYREDGVRVKYLAFAMIESAAPRRGPGNVRALELALRISKDCLESELVELGLKSLETTAARLDTFEKSETDKSKLSVVTTEYYMLRIYLSWLQGRPDIAEHLFSKVSAITGSPQRKTNMEVCYIIGSSALSKGQPGTATRWLERALESSLRSGQDSGQSNLALKDMRLLILHALVRAHLQLGTASSRDFALQTLDSLKTEYRDIFPVVMLQLEVFGKEEHPNYHDYSECLGAVVRMTEVTDDSLRIAFYHIQKLSKQSWDLSMKVSQQLLEKLVPSNSQALIGQFLVAFVWMVTSSNQSALQELDTILGIAKTLARSGIDTLGEDATHASLVLIWRRVKTMMSNGNIFMAEQWYQFVLEQPIFQNCSTANRSVLQRKLMICALNNPSTSLSYEVLERMLEQSQGSPSTLYLAYRITLLHDEPALGISVLEALFKLGANGAMFLFSCATEAQRLGKMQQMMDSVERVMAILDSGYREIFDFPTLVGSTIHMLSMELENCKVDDTKILEQISRTFRVALKGLTESSSIFSTDDTEWFFQKSYNLALQLVKSARYIPAIKLIDISQKLAVLYSQTAQPEDTPKVFEHNLSCEFLKALVLITEAREEAEPLKKKNHYNSLRNTIEHFRTHIVNRTQSQQNQEATVPVKWQEKYRALLSFDFEAAVFLSHWDALPSIIEESSSFADSKLCAVFLDSILSAEAPIGEMVRVVMTIINILHTSTAPTLNKSSFETSLPRYLRCLFQLSIQANENPLAEAILDKAMSLARGHNDENTSTNTNINDNGRTKSYDYPNEELEWLATVTFNRAIDFYLVSADEECKRWAGKAIEIADLVGYNHGALGRLLRANLAKLS